MKTKGGKLSKVIRSEGMSEEKKKGDLKGRLRELRRKKDQALENFALGLLKCMFV